MDPSATQHLHGVISRTSIDRDDTIDSERLRSKSGDALRQPTRTIVRDHDGGDTNHEGILPTRREREKERDLRRVGLQGSSRATLEATTFTL